MDYKLEISKLRFESKINKTETCWEWKGTIRNCGYGSFLFNKKNWLAHRLSWYFYNNTEAKLSLLHSCDNKLCVNPKHLREGTQYENVHDMINRNRRVLSYSENSGLAKLTFKQANEIRERYKNEGKSQKYYAEEYKVNQSVISRIIKNITYTIPPKQS